MRSSGKCELNTSFFGERDNSPGAALWNIEGNEVTALGSGPRHVGNMGKLFVEDAERVTGVTARAGGGCAYAPTGRSLYP